jgi:SAM-dependent methyltransferase
MKIRESGMPAQALWEQFFAAEQVLRTLRLTAGCRNLLEFGCGYGTFTLPAARMISGTLHTLELDTAMLTIATDSAVKAGLENIVFHHRDFVAQGSGLNGQTVDYAMLFNILHLEQPVPLLREAWRNLAAGGLLAIIHWIHDADTPRGPPLPIRPKPGQCLAWAEEAGFVALDRLVELPPYHYGLVLKRPS